MGFLLHKQLIDIETIECILSGSTIAIWEKLKPITEGMRTQYNMQELATWSEYLYEELQKREQLSS
jgi:hypothetical protein